MKILIIPSWYPSDANPLWGKYFIQQAEALNEWAEVSFLNINRVGVKQIGKLFSIKKHDGYSNKKYKFHFYEKSILNLRFINLDLSYMEYQRAAYSAYKKMEKIIGRPDVILAESSLPAGLAACYISEKEKIPFFVHEHSYDTLTKPMYRKHVEKVVKEAKMYMAVQDRIKNEILGMGKDCKIIPNYIDTKKFDIEPTKNKKFTMVTICNFYKVKALEVLFQALNKVVYEDNVKDIVLNVVGTGDYEEYYKQEAHNLKLDEYVIFMGYVDNTKVPKIIAKADTLCVSSRIETFCIPIVEAFASGKPVISTKCGGPNILVDEARGIKVEVDDVEGYRKAILEMKENYKKYDPEKLKKFARENYDKQVVCKEIIDICKK